MDRRAWTATVHAVARAWTATVHAVAESDTSEVTQHEGMDTHCLEGFPDGSVVKNPPVNAGSPGKGKATHSSLLAWEILWTEKSGGLQSMGSQESDTTQ